MKTLESARNADVSLLPQRQEALLFELAEHRFGLPVSDVVELTRACALQALPEAPALVLGVLNLRGEVVAVLDLRRRLGLPEAPLDASNFFVLVRIAARLTALRVDRLLGTAWMEVVPAAETPHLTLDLQRFSGVAAVDDGVVLIYDVAKFLSESEAVELNAALGRNAGEA